MSNNDRLLDARACAGDSQSRTEIGDLAKEIDQLRANLVHALGRAIRVEGENIELRAQVEDLRAEALAWHAQEAGESSQITITLSLESLRQLWAEIRPRNPYTAKNEED